MATQPSHAFRAGFNYDLDAAIEAALASEVTSPSTKELALWFLEELDDARSDRYQEGYSGGFEAGYDAALEEEGY